MTTAFSPNPVVGKKKSWFSCSVLGCNVCYFSRPNSPRSLFSFRSFTEESRGAPAWCKRTAGLEIASHKIAPHKIAPHNPLPTPQTCLFPWAV